MRAGPDCAAGAMSDLELDPRNAQDRLRGRDAELSAFDRLLKAVRAGQSRVLVVRGEPGVGKTALLRQLNARASGCRVLRMAAIQAEMELPFAGLHLLCGEVLARADDLPAPQRDALRTAFGLSAGPVPDRFLVGLATLTLLSETARDPLVCLIDDAQWLDRASAEALTFVARRLLAEAVALVVATRDDHGFSGLPELVVDGLNDRDSHALLRSAVGVPLDEQVADRIVAETRGNPLALLELPRGLSPAQLAGGFGVPDAPALAGQIEESFQRRLFALPAPSRGLLPWRPPSRPAILCSSGAPASGSASARRWQRPLTWAVCASSARRCAFAIRSRGRRSTAPRRLRPAGPSTRRWRTSPTPSSTLIVAHGIARTRPWGSTSRSPSRWNGRPAARRCAVVWRPQPRC
jgi:AAA ATPase domain